MRTLLVCAALLGGLSLAACDDRSETVDLPEPQPERQIEPIEEETAPVIDPPAPYVDDMGGDLETFRNDSERPPPEVILPPEPEETEDAVTPETP